MKRDMDLIRNILLRIENGENTFPGIGKQAASNMGFKNLDEFPDQDEADVFEYHLRLLRDADFLQYASTNRSFHIDKITWAGHDFLDSVRNDEIWERTKEGVEAAGGFSLDILSDLAKGLIRTQIKKHTGIEV